MNKQKEHLNQMKADDAHKIINYDKLKDTVKKLTTCLSNLADNADEDCLAEYRTRHFSDSLQEARELLKIVR